MSQRGSSSRTARDGSRTITLLDSQPIPDTSAGDVGPSGRPDPPLQGRLILRGGPRSRPRVAWDEAVVDNEGCGRKKSKICCIYHKPKRFDESSDESDTDSDSGCEHGHNHTHNHRNGNQQGAGAVAHREGESTVHEIQDQPARNAYEATPKNDRGKGKGKA
ncbi:hypothetical protein BOTBODRAFT_39475 [Botryobasidium botryosum FD-172 SS1]|uniref:Type 1 phosphatases regulator n=1 Tax=Botryobasidium botryosum (strain FD-172 SS1) TaxID=930990 RepID=A0A067LTY8_BOTB1|nr:hypothetical protein BOTBODRAFT_39475 [Botryobasidium botryosum FD-172 SS1]